VSTDPLNKPKDAYTETINRIKSDQSAVGIDAQYTHAIIIDYLKSITKKLEEIEQKLNN